MRFAFTDEQNLLRESIRGALQREIPIGRVREDIEAGAPTALRAVAAQQGWGGIGIPEEAGGQGGGAVEQAILVEELARAAVPGSTVLTGALAAALLGPAGAGGADLLARLADDAARPVVLMRADTARPGDVEVAGGRAEGVVPHVLGAPEADVLLAVADERLVAVDAAGDGVALDPRDLLDIGRSIAGVSLSGVAAEDLGPVGDLADLRARASVLAAADALGAAAGMLAMTVEYVAQREQFGVAVGSFQAVKHGAADMLVAVETAHSAVYYAAWTTEAGHPDRDKATAVAKSFAGTAAAGVADSALALHGAVGFTWEHDLHLLMRRAYTAKALFGSPSAHDAALADALDLAPRNRPAEPVPA